MEFLGRLDEVVKQKTKKKQEAWTNEMYNLSKATKWIKQSCPPQFLLRGGWLAGLHVKVIHNVWKAIFGCDTNEEADPQNSCRMYKDDLPEETQAQTLPKLNKWQVRNMLTWLLPWPTKPRALTVFRLNTS